MSNAIQRQFHHLLRIVPGNGLVIVNAADAHLAEVLSDGLLDAARQFRHRCRRPLARAPLIEDGLALRGAARWQAAGTVLVAAWPRTTWMNALAAIRRGAPRSGVSMWLVPPRWRSSAA
jgi:UDP-N-acetylmuramate: L-alanyl-gamma-D-glutamyl-meso-diaminopimelate ligase